jgi:putative N-acetylmannosamine-6-phosphate epimerase
MHLKERIENNIAIIALDGTLQNEPDAILLRETLHRFMEKILFI